MGVKSLSPSPMKEDLSKKASSKPMDEFEVLFSEQRKAVAERNIPLFERMEAATKRLFTATE